MTTEDEMTLKERNKYLRGIQSRYTQAPNRAVKSALLDEAQKVTGLNRDYLIQKLRHPIHRRARSRERGRTYGGEVDAALAQIATAQGNICPERLSGYLLETAENLVHRKFDVVGGTDFISALLRNLVDFFEIRLCGLIKQLSKDVAVVAGYEKTL